MEDAPSHVSFPGSDPPDGEQVIEGEGAVKGIAIGTAYRYDPSVPDVKRDPVPPAEVDGEVTLLANAVERARQELETVQVLAHQSLGEDGKAIVEAQALMLQDEELLQAIEDRIRGQREPAGAAVRAVLQKHKKRLESSDDQYFQDRAEDIVDLERRLLRALRRGKVAAGITPQSVVVASTLTATDILHFSQRGMGACITEEGGATSHVSIIAEALQLPTVVGAAGAMEGIPPGARVIVDGEAGCVIVHPSASTLEAYERRRTDAPAPAAEGASVSPAVTTDGHKIPLRANVELEGSLDLLEPYGADGIGLLRTEMLLLSEGRGILSEERQLAAYRKAAEAAGESGVTIRLLDLGGDKRVPFSPTEDNPALGWRGIRVLLDRPDDLLRPQLRAILRANKGGHVRVLLPMVTDLHEVERVRALLQEEADRLDAAGVSHDRDLPFGIMVEVPAVPLRAEQFAEHVDFFSIGTNDLTQYVLAVDRANGRVADRFDALHPAVLGLIHRTVKAGHAHDCSVEVCGESASDVQAVPVLLGLGVDGLSASPRSLPAVRRMIRHVALSETQALSEGMLSLPDAEAVRREVGAWLDDHVSLDQNGA